MNPPLLLTSDPVRNAKLQDGTLEDQVTEAAEQETAAVGATATPVDASSGSAFD